MEARRAHPQPPVGPPRWPTELRWLSSTWPDAQAYLDPADFAWVESEVRAIRGTLASLVRLKPHPRYLCPDQGCGAQMHLDEDGWMRCESGHTHPGPKRLEAEWRRKPPMPTKELCSALRVPEGTVYRWHHEKLLTPTRQEGRVMFWLPWDLIALRYPDIVTDINERDAA